MDISDNCLNITIGELVRIPNELDVSTIDRIRIIKTNFPVDIDGITLYPPRPIKPPYIIKDMINNLIQNYHVTFSDKERIIAEDFFIAINYYKFCIYPKLIDSSPSFKDVMYLYRFDNILREHMLSLIPRVESYIKTTWAYYTSHNYLDICKNLSISDNGYPPGLVYLNKGIYQKEDIENGRVSDMLHDLACAVKSRRKQELSVLHHIINYGGHIPIWAIVEQMTFGNISTLITSVKRQVRKPWVDTYFAGLYATPKSICSWIHCFVALRNITSHGGRLYGRTFTYSPSFDDSDIAFSEYNKDALDAIRPSLFAGLLVMKKIFTKLNKNDITDWNKFIYILSKQINHSKQIIKIEKMGFPENWKELLAIETS